MAEAYKRFIFPELGKVVAAEEYWTMYVDGHGLCGIIDAVNDEGIPIEFKTTSAPVGASDYLLKIEHDEQVKTYMIATGKNRMIYAVMQTPNIRQRANESNEDFEERCLEWYDYSKVAVFDVVVEQEKLDKFKDELAKTMKEIEECDLFYCNPNNCTKWGNLCEYAQICETEYDPSIEYVGFERRS